MKRHGGLVQDVVGDSMLADLGDHRAGPSLRSRACLAALDIATAVDRFNAASGRLALPTRIGLHSGRLLLGKRRRDGSLRVPGGRRHREHGHPPGGPQQAPRDSAAGERRGAPWPGRPYNSRAWVVPPGRQVEADRGPRAAGQGRRSYRIRPGALCYLCRGSGRLPAWSLVRRQCGSGKNRSDRAEARMGQAAFTSGGAQRTPPSRRPPTGMASCAWTRSSQRAA